ncbi:MAG: hypothetical protein ACKPKO_11365, partial [Candidatus Fonsibacter sp.]
MVDGKHHNCGYTADKYDVVYTSPVAPWITADPRNLFVDGDRAMNRFPAGDPIALAQATLRPWNPAMAV